MPTTKPILKIIVPCYNEEDLLSVSCKEFKNIIIDLIKERLISDKSFILFVNDGSIDNTWNIIKNLSKDDIYTGISLAHNKGHQTALLAGLLDETRESANLRNSCYHLWGHRPSWVLDTNYQLSVINYCCPYFNLGNYRNCPQS